MHMSIPPHLLKRLGLHRRDDNFFVSADQVAGHSYADALRKALAVGASGVFCLEGVPSTAIVYISELDSGVGDASSSLSFLQGVYRSLWNLGTLDYLMVMSATSLALYSLWENPERFLTSQPEPIPTQKPKGQPSTNLLEEFELLGSAARIEEILTGIESGRYFASHGNYFDPRKRVDALLLRDLGIVRGRLLGASPGGERIRLVHEALLQAIFLQYLWDREILSPNYLLQCGDGTHDTLDTLLLKSPTGFYRLLSHLEHDLNGCLFSANNPIWAEEANTIAAFFKGKTSFGVTPSQDQLRFMRLYEFQYIPVELLSEIYDRFLEAEGSRKLDGAYYTPRRLAALLVDRIWDRLKEYLDRGQIPKVLDPACGSGIFLVTLFQRMAAYRETTDWDNLKLLSTSLHGVDISRTAVRISAFSLSLALLDKREPREIVKEMRGKGKMLPKLFHGSIRELDFFDFEPDASYDFVVGNPPWGKAKGSNDTSGESWLKAQKATSIPAPPTRELSWPFLWKIAGHVNKESLIAFVLPSRGFFLKTQAKDSLATFVSRWHLEEILDLTDLRNTLFPTAKVPACIVTVRNKEPQGRYKFRYLCPKADLNTLKADRILLSQDDAHYVYVHDFASTPISTSKRLMWTTAEEQRLLSYLDGLPSLQQFPLKQLKKIPKKDRDAGLVHWVIGSGFERATLDTKTDENKGLTRHLANLPYVSDVTDISPWIVGDVSHLAPYQGEVRWDNFQESFTAPHIALPLRPERGDGFRLAASYSDYNFCFSNNYCGIKVPNTPEGKRDGKLLTAILNSKFAVWYMAVCSPLGADRERFAATDILPLPFPQPEDFPDAERAEVIRDEICMVLDSMLARVSNLPDELLRAENEGQDRRDVESLDRLVFEYFGLREHEIRIIEDSLQFIRPAMHPNASSFPDLWGSSEMHQWSKYCEALSEGLTVHMQEGVRAESSIVGHSEDCVLVKVSRRIGRERAVPTEGPAYLYDLPEDLLQKIEAPLGGGFFMRRYAMVFKGDDIFILKPRQLRFWLTGAAYADAERVMRQLDLVARGQTVEGVEYDA